MRLWHEKLLPYLDRQRLLAQHRECCAMRGNGWGKKHSTVDWCYKYGAYRLFLYHEKVMQEMKNRGYKPDPIWSNPLHRGKKCEPWDQLKIINLQGIIYPEHNDVELVANLNLLKDKGVPITEQIL